MEEMEDRYYSWKTDNSDSTVTERVLKFHSSSQIYSANDERIYVEYEASIFLVQLAPLAYFAIMLYERL